MGIDNGQTFLMGAVEAMWMCYREVGSESKDASKIFLEFILASVQWKPSKDRLALRFTFSHRCWGSVVEDM